MNRRNFLSAGIAAGLLGGMPSWAKSAMIQQPLAPSDHKMIWAYLIHLSYNMWEDNTPEEFRDPDKKCDDCPTARAWSHKYQPNLTFDQPVWDTVISDMAAAGMNMLIIDLGDAVLYDSHPEIAVRNAWTPDKLRSELAKIRKLGIEPIPKLNFATTHDTWMGEYSKMVSSRKYYEVCSDLIREVSELFDRPRYFHLGMDEETAEHQERWDYVVIRKNNVWWGDLYFLISEVEKQGVRPWVWSDYAWKQPDIFFKKMPKSVMQSNWYYGGFSDADLSDSVNRTYVQLYDKLEQYGYDQIPTGSNFSSDSNMKETFDYCNKIIDPSRLYGYMTAPWHPTMLQCQPRLREAVKQVGSLIK
ncbi:MAG: Tat pathway signal protein [Dysgonamonadaceae bacterium]|jgi:hypothetical protein|nr:Tat pathway signal protein [Dysgonamonadaceae bacterium]